MTSKEKELNGYLGFAEKMSGYDGMDYFEGDLSSFDDYDDFDDFDDYDDLYDDDFQYDDYEDYDDSKESMSME